jgi:uncharacterized protein YjiS (DUF1127 family)
MRNFFPQVQVQRAALETSMPSDIPSDVPVGAAVKRAHGHALTCMLDAALGFCVSFKSWWHRRRTLRALADLDDRLLRDIGITRGETRPWWLSDRSYRALAALDDTELIHLSDIGRRARRDARHGGSHAGRW